MCQPENQAATTSSPTTKAMAVTGGGPVVIPDAPRDIDASKCIYPAEYEGHFDRLLIPKEEISSVVHSLAEKIHEDYQGRRPVMMCVLKGSGPFYQHLLDELQELRQGYYTEFIRTSSYEGTASTGKVKLAGGVDFKNLNGRDVVLVEDIVDTGTTVSHLIPVLEAEGKPASVTVCTLLSKRLDQPPKYRAKYVGFSIPNHFIVGYGLDYNELYRDVRDIWVISQAGIDFDSTTLN